jgi:hypothetical protein
MAIRAIEIYIVQPKEATNLITNPSFETVTTGYTALQSSLARSATYQRRGVYSLDLSPNTGQIAGVYYSVALTAGLSYTFSCDVKDVAGQTFNLYFADTSGNAQGTPTTWTGDGYWKRKAVTWTAASTTTYRLYLTRSAVASTSHYYTDGWQCEAGAESTYFDGDCKGWHRTRVDYYWNGVPHASTSFRSGKTRSGGTMLRLRDYVNLIGTIGLGMAVVANNAVPTGGGGSYYTGTSVQNRPIDLAVQFLDNAGYSGVAANRAAIVNAIKPDNVPTNEPLTLLYQLEDSSGNPAGDMLKIHAHYSGGLEQNTTGNFAQVEDKTSISFITFMPFLSSDGTQATALGYQTSVSDFANIGYRDTDGTWKAMGTGMNGMVLATVAGPDGALYAAGAFTAAGGVANTAYIAKWNGTAWSALGSGANGIVWTLAVGPDGALYAGGEFTQMGGVANTARIAKWDGSAWSALGTGTNGTVDTLAFGRNGRLYAGGSFTLAGGVANTVRIAKWDIGPGGTWSALGTGMDNMVDTLAVGMDGSVYAGGQFTLAGGVTVSRIAKWNGSAWSTLGTGTNDTVHALAIGADGTLYAGGAFTQADGRAAGYIAKWDGASWATMGDGLDSSVWTLTIGTDGALYAGGEFNTAGGVPIPDHMALWRNGIWNQLDVDVQDSSAYVYAMTFDLAGRLYLGGSWSGTTALSATVTVPNVSGGAAHPVVKFAGPGTLWQLKNYTTGKTIYFNNLTLLAGETAILDLRPGRISFKSSWNARPNLLPYIAPGTDYEFPLLGGANNVSAYMTGTTAASGIVMEWEPLYWSVDGAAR